MNHLKKKQLGKSLRIRNSDVSSCHNTDFGMRNPIFRSKLSKSGVQRWTYRILMFEKNEKFKKIKTTSCDLLNSHPGAKKGKPPIDLNIWNFRTRNKKNGKIWTCPIRTLCWTNYELCVVFGAMPCVSMITARYLRTDLSVQLGTKNWLLEGQSTNSSFA